MSQNKPHWHLDKDYGGEGFCLLCHYKFEYVYTAYESAGVCGECAEWVANIYNHAHSGDYLTWPNERVLDPEAERRKRMRARLGIRAKLKIFERDEYRCKRCGSHSDLQCDHIVPVSKGGTNEPENLQTLCGPCNMSKGARS